MTIWVDADACPRPIKEILFRAADKRSVHVVLVANQWLQVPRSDFIEFMQVSHGADIADDEIAEKCEAGDLVVTADIPLAARVVEKGALALDPRGTVYDKSNIGHILGMRNFMDDLRSSGVETGGPSSFGQKERLEFSNALDVFLTKNT